MEKVCQFQPTSDAVMEAILMMLFFGGTTE
jgi:hypothetical protein